MANSCAGAAFLHPSASWQALLVFISLTAVHAADAGAQGQCPHFSCGDLHNISSPFRRPGDPPECGVQAYELACNRDKATIRINTGTYSVTSINYSDHSFCVVDTNLDMHSSCPLPRWDQFPDAAYLGSRRNSGSHLHSDLATQANWACYVNCSQKVTENSFYKAIDCLSSNNTFVYVMLYSGGYGCAVTSLEPFCGYLAIIPFGSEPSIHFDDWLSIYFDNWSIIPSAWWLSNPFVVPYLEFQNASYADIVRLLRKGFSVHFPLDYYLGHNASWIFKTCRMNSTSYFYEQLSGTSILNWTRAFFWSESHFAQCVSYYDESHAFQKVVIAVVSVISVAKLHFVLCKLVLSAMVLFTFLAHKYGKTRITIDAVEKFLKMQQMLGPTRFAYTDITAVTSHFRDKLGQGGYGSVYKGVLLPSNVQVAVKMLGNSNCNGDEFISEVSTIGRIHHVNVVRLVGFCAEEMRRALVYEYMSNGSLDKYIFSTERSFSWDKLNEIALGIARGINYLHLGCDMQILHFDIKRHNILLDSNFVPKVADFGLAKLYPRDKSFVPASAMRGTIGYIAPEMVSHSFGAISSKSDIYSFGMLLLEMAGGRRNANQNVANSSQAYYLAWVYDRLVEQEVGEISVVADMHELERKLCIVGLRCIQMKPHDRPTMSEVIDLLECTTDDGLQIPSRPFFCNGHMVDTGSYHFSSEFNAIEEEDD